MNLLFYKMRTGKKGQIVAVLTVALIIFIIAAFIVVNLGKARIQDTKVNNAAQAAVLAGGSAASVLLNSMANLNDQMVLNFAGFTLMIQFMLVSWIADYAQTIKTAYSSLEAFNSKAATDTILAVMTLALTTATIALMISGATEVGNAIEKMIDSGYDSLNAKLPKNSRDPARQYGFSNAGVDEPKLPFSKSGCLDAWCYSMIETKFDEFMRALPAKNKADINFGTSTIEFDWDDSRSGHIVNNKVAVTVTPVQKVPFRLMKFSDVADESEAINDYLDEQELGLLGPLIRFGVNIADVLIALIWSTTVLIGALAGILYDVAGQASALAEKYWARYSSCCHPKCSTTCYLLPYALYYDWVDSKMTIAGSLAAAASVAFFIIYDSYPPGDIPCFVWEQRREHPISAEVTRTTTPSSINYGIYRTNWPEQTHQASGTVKDGSIFPPNQNFDIIPDF